MVVNKNNSKRDDGGAYGKVINEIADTDLCPFCPGDMYLKHHTEPIIKDGKYWLFTKNSYPYKNTKAHLFFILKRHATKIEELSSDELGEISIILAEYLPKHKITGGALFIRSGDTSITGSSVEHIHAQFVSKDPSSPEPLLVKLG